MINAANWNWPQTLVIIIYASSIILSLTVKYRKLETISCTKTFVVNILELIFLILGGFFNTWSWPQIIYILLLISIGAVTFYKDGLIGETTVHLGKDGSIAIDARPLIATFNAFIFLSLFTMGGFFA